MRLIDADDFKKKYCEENCGKRKCVDAMDKCNFILSLEEQPTAYDVEKVVEQLKELKIDIERGCVAVSNKKCSKYFDCGVCMMDRVSEIVKQGCVGTDDVCEWKYNDEFEFAKSECGAIDTHRIAFRKLKFCPYCGKKIKVVD